MSKGYILGTVNKRTGKDFSLNPDPKVHLDYQSALTEAKRLLTSNSINNTRKIVILNKLNNRIKELGYTINVSEDVVSYLGEVGYDSKYGARPLNRAIQKYIEDEICEAILNETVVKGQVINISIEESTKKIIVS
jgi:ATP-dependent Clp protease ATP-binding subunit ClpA